MESRLLVPLDGSSLAEQALSCAVMLGKELPAELVLLRAVHLPGEAQKYLGEATEDQSKLVEQFDAEADDYLRKTAGSLRQAGMSVQHVIQHGPAAEAIVDYAEQTEITQIVMATHGYSGIRRWTHGSVAERVLQAARVPVLLIRAQEQVEDDSPKSMLCRRILVPLDGSQMAEQVLPPVTSIAQAIEAEVLLLQIAIDRPASMLAGDWFFLPVEGEFEEEEQAAMAYLERVAGPLREEGIAVSTNTEIGPVATSIVEYAEAKHVDLIAMCTHGRTGLARWALGSVADRVLRAGGIPILLVRVK
jgi:nucleotide-binding universal stress UspA family protein